MWSGFWGPCNSLSSSVSPCVVGKLCVPFILWRGPKFSPDSLNEKTSATEKLGTDSAGQRGKPRASQVGMNEPRTISSENTEPPGLGGSGETRPPLPLTEALGFRKAWGFSWHTHLSQQADEPYSYS